MSAATDSLVEAGLGIWRVGAPLGRTERELEVEAEAAIASAHGIWNAPYCVPIGVAAFLLGGAVWAWHHEK